MVDSAQHAHGRVGKQRVQGRCSGIGRGWPGRIGVGARGCCSWHPACCWSRAPVPPVSHLRENLAAEHVAVDDEALRELAGVGVWPS